MWRGRPAWIRPLAPDSSRQLNSCPSASLAVAEHPTYACVCLDSWPYVLYQQGHSKSVLGLVMSTRVRDPDLWGHRVNTLLFFIFSFFELGTHFTFPVNGCCVHTVTTCELHHKGLTGRGKLELIILLNLTVFVKCVNISNWFVSMSTVREVFPTLEVNGLFWQRQKQSTSLLNTRVVDGDIIILSLTPESTVFVPFSWLTLSHHSILRKMIHRTKSQLKTGDPRTTKSNCNAPRSYK